MKIVRKIEMDDVNIFKRYSDWQSLYMNMSSGDLIPDTEIWSKENLFMKVNSIGCKGNDIDPASPVIAFFGDSTTFGVSFSADSWPVRVAIEGVQALNAAVEGYNMDRVFKRYIEIKGKVELLGAVIYSGWHNIIYNETSEDYWSASLDRFAGDHLLAFCTLATCLTDECKEKGVERLLCSDSPRRDYANYFEYNRESLDKRYFNFWCNIEPSLGNIRMIVDGVQRYNDFLVRYCARRGHVLLDLYSLLLPKSYEEIPNDFYDVCHPRSSAYPKIAGYVSSILDKPAHDLLKNRTKPSLSQAEKDVEKGENFEDLRKNIYPLW